MSKEESIDLWTQRGISYNEVRNRLNERSDLECLTAFKWMRNWGVITVETGLLISKSADLIRDSKSILIGTVDHDGVEQFILPGLKSIPKLKRLMILELHALVVEAYVRSANQCFPLQFNN